MYQVALGIDISKRCFDATLLWSSGKASHQAFSNTTEGFRKLKVWLARQKTGTVHACMEATGRYGEVLARFLIEGGHWVSVVNPKRIKAYGDSKLRRNKSDKADALLIAEFCLKETPRLWEPLQGEVYELQAMVRYLDALEKMRQQERNRLSAGLSSPTVREQIEEHIAYLEARMIQLRDKVQAHINRDRGLKRQQDLLISIPGIGELTAVKILAEIGDIRRFKSAKKLAAYAGLTPYQQDSGSSVRKRPRLSKLGNAHLRKALYLPAIVAKTHNPIVHAFCERLSSYGKCPMAIIGAAMHKLLRIAYGVLKSGRPFNADLAPSSAS